MLLCPPVHRRRLRFSLGETQAECPLRVSEPAVRDGNEMLCCGPLPRIDDLPRRATSAVRSRQRATQPLLGTVRATCIWSLLWAAVIAAIATSTLGLPPVTLIAYCLGSLASSLSVLVVTFKDEGATL